MTNKAKTLLTVCLGSSCFSRGNNDQLQVIRQFLLDHHLEDRVLLKGSRCEGHCLNGPNLRIGDTLIQEVRADQVVAILETHLCGGTQGSLAHTGSLNPNP